MTSTNHFYFSLQYSAIQKTVLRHDRLWSIAGISQMLSELNEIDMRNIAKEPNEIIIIIAGGGKFTARFHSEEQAKAAKKKLTELISTKLPMLEYQMSSIVPAESLKDAQKKELNGKPYPGIVHELSEKKRVFRGYGITFNPHIKVCEECEEYPAEKGLYAPKNKKLCRICHTARKNARIDLLALKSKDDEKLTSINRIYKKYLEFLKADVMPEIPLDMEDLFPGGEDLSEKGKRIAVWMSDINNMGDMVPLWLMQDEEKILGTFDNLKEFFIDVLADALKKVFPSSKWVVKSEADNKAIVHTYIPFRLIVAGGDDLCIVMPEKYILEFVRTYSSIMNEKVKNIKTYGDTLTKQWLIDAADNANKEAREKNEKEREYVINDISFGGSFIVTSIHTPFTRIHSVGEDLMGKAKRETKRKGNSVNWLILEADEEFQSKNGIKGEKPLFIEEDSRETFENEPKKRLSFNEYLTLCKQHKDISGSHLHQIAGKIIEYNGDSERVETWLLRMPEAGKENSVISGILADKRLKSNGKLNIERLVTLLELLTIYSGEIQK